MEDEVRRLLGELEETIHRAQEDGELDDQERAELLELASRVERALARPDEQDEGVVDHLEATAVRFEGEHPTLSQVLRSTIDAVSGYGI